MKKILLAILLLGLSFGAIQRYGSIRNGWIVDEIIAEQVLSGNSFNLEVDGILAFSSIDLVVTSVATGSVETATLSWLNQAGTVVSSNTLTAGTSITKFSGKKVNINIANDVNTPNVFTMQLIYK